MHKTIAVISAKGGAGKSTLCALLGHVFREGGHRVAIKDYDPQQTSAFHLEHYDNGLLKYEDDQEFDVVIIDTAPRIEHVDVARAIDEADRIIIPVSPFTADLPTTIDTVKKLKQIDGAVAKTRILPFKVPSGNIKEGRAEHVKTVLSFLDGVQHSKNKITHSASYTRVLSEGWSALSKKEKEELLHVAMDILAF